MYKKIETFEELQVLVASTNTRKEFKAGDVIVCTITPWGQRKPEPGAKSVVVEKVTTSVVPDGTSHAASEVGDYLVATLEDRHPQGFDVRFIHSGHYVLESEYTPTETTED